MKSPSYASFCPLCLTSLQVDDCCAESVFMEYASYCAGKKGNGMGGETHGGEGSYNREVLCVCVCVWLLVVLQRLCIQDFMPSSQL